MTVEKINTHDRIVHWKGIVKVPVDAQERRPAWEQRALQAALMGGEGALKQLRYVCRIAQDANRAFKSLRLVDGSTFFLDSGNKAQFGRNHAGLAFLTLGLIEGETGEKYRLKWEGDAVPLKMQEIAVQHDEGRAVRACTLALDVARATVTHKGTRTGQPSGSYRDGDGNPYPKRSYRSNRLCRDDLKEMPR